MASQKNRLDIDDVLSAMSLKSLISGFGGYRQTFADVLKFRGNFYKTLMDRDRSEVLRQSIITYLYGIAATFLLYVPFILKHGLSFGKVEFLLQFIYLQCVVVSLITLSAKVFRGHGTFKDTLAAYCFWVGVCSPVIILLCYPLWWYVASGSVMGIEATQTANVPPWVVLWTVLVFILLAVTAYLLGIRWVADLHGMTRRRLTLALCVVYLPLMLLHNTFVAPYVTKVLKMVTKFLEVIL